MEDKLYQETMREVPLGKVQDHVTQALFEINDVNRELLALAAFSEDEHIKQKFKRLSDDLNCALEHLVQIDLIVSGE